MSELLGGRYRLERKLASGGMGDVWVAHDQTLGRRVAIKLLRDALAEDPVVAERFRREALTAASFSHPNIADVYDYVENGTRRGIVMELVDGETLAQRLRRGRLDVGEAVRITTEVLEALSAAHAAGIVHRDIKPGNIMITTAGKVRVTDFGIARAEGDATLTETGAVMGTAHYASPEQVQGRGTTPASDLYSLGLVLYETLAGKRPFEAETPVAAALMRLTKDPPRPRRARREIPSSVEAVVMKALAREPADRYASAEEMRAALISALGEADTDVIATSVMTVAASPRDETTVLVAASGDDATTKAHPRAVPAAREDRRAASLTVVGGRRRRRTVVLALLVALAAVLGAVAGLSRRQEPPPAANPKLVPVPKLDGKPVRDAVMTLTDLGLRVDLQQATSVAPEGTVVRQSPAPGTPLPSQGTVVLVVSSGRPGTPCCTVPDLTGMSEDDAEEALRKAGLQLGEVTKQARSGVREGTVIGQNPAKGKIVAPGSSVDIVIARKRGKGGED